MEVGDGRTDGGRGGLGVIGPIARMVSAEMVGAVIVVTAGDDRDGGRRTAVATVGIGPIGHGVPMGRAPGPPDRGDRPDEERRRHRPHFTPPPEVPQRPKPKRLRPGKQHRIGGAGLAAGGAAPVAELALQGMPAVRQRLREDNARLRAEGKPPMPEAGDLEDG